MAARLVRLLFLLLAGTGMAEQAVATDIRLMGDWAYTFNDSEIEERESDTVTETSNERLQQTYRLDLNSQLFPTLNLNSGVQVETTRSNSESAGQESDNRSQQILPYIDMEWYNPLYSLSGGYRERTATSEIDGQPEEKEYLTNYNLRGEWRPVELPRLEFNYQHSERYDDPLTQDTESDILQLSTRYELRQYELRYNYLQNDEENFINDSASSTFSHNAQLRYNNSFLDERLSVNVGLRGEYTEQQFSGSGPQEARVPTLERRFFTTSTPPDEINFNILELNAQGTESVGSLELPPTSSSPDAEPWYLALLQVSDQAEVDRLRLDMSFEQEETLDRDAGVRQTGNWTLWVSDDQEVWIPFGISSITVDNAQNQLDILLSGAATSEYFLLVYTPPAVTSTNSDQFVEVTAISPLVQTEEPQLTTQNYQGQLGLGWRFSEATRLSYNSTLQESRSSLFDEQNTRFNQGLNVLHLFNSVFRATGRISSGYAWEQGTLRESLYSYSARLSARYLETLNQALIYSGSLNQDETEGDSTSNSLILRTNAKLYEGWDISFDQGVSVQDGDNSDQTTRTFVRIQNSFVPHSSYSLNIDYSINWDRDPSGTERSESTRMRAFWVPRDSMSLSGEVLLRSSDGGGSEMSWQGSASWLPLRDGSLQCSLSYSQEEQLDGDRIWTFTPNVSWEITYYTTLSLRYSLGEQKTERDINRFQTAFLNLRIYYD